MSSSMGSTRLPEEGEKIEVRCDCGKRYRVSASKAGGQVRCKGCKARIEVPGEPQISGRTAQAILDELGIKKEADPKAAGTYRCALCSAKLVGEDVREAYGSEGLICSLCRAQMGESGATAGAAAAGEGEKKKKKELDTWVRQGSGSAALGRAVGVGALVFVGIGGFLHNLIRMHPALTVLVAGVLAGLAAWQIHKGYQPVVIDNPAKSRAGKKPKA